jgi:hypothetical protein
MRHLSLVLLATALVALVAPACTPDQPKPPPPEPEVEGAKAVKMGSAETPPPVVAKPDARPEPTTPAEISAARKQAMIDVRDKDAVRYCDMEKLDPKKSDPQALLGCALAACRTGEIDKAKAWAANLPKPLKEQAVKVCTSLGVDLSK